jgi:hypothetical protein
MIDTIDLTWNDDSQAQERTQTDAGYVLTRIPTNTEIAKKLNEVIERVNQLDALSGIDREIRGTTV